jgi:hypothetical protein
MYNPKTKKSSEVEQGRWRRGRGDKKGGQGGALTCEREQNIKDVTVYIEN